MAISGITVEMYQNLEATLKIYKEKAASQGLESLTKEDKKNITNIGSVLKLVRFTALKEIVKNAISGDYSRVIEYYSQKESEIVEQIAELNLELAEISNKIIDALAMDDLNEIDSLKNQYNASRDSLDKKNVEYEEFMKNQLKPEDFVINIIGSDGNELVKAAVSEIIYSSQYLGEPKSLNEPSTLYSFSMENVPIINDNLVQLAIDFLNGKNEDLENLKSVLYLKDRLNSKKSLFQRNLNLLYTNFMEYQTCLESCRRYRNAIGNTRFSFSVVKNGSNETLGYRKADIEKRLIIAEDKLNELDKIVTPVYEYAIKQLTDRVNNLPRKHEVFSSEMSVKFFFKLVSSEYEKILSEEEIETKRATDELSAKIKPEYLKLDPEDIDRITYYGRGRLETDEFIKIKENLELLSVVSQTQKGVENPEEIVSTTDKEIFEAQTREAIDEHIASMSM